MSEAGSFLRGFGVTAGITIGAVIFGGLTLWAGIGAIVLLGISLVQLAWVLPLYISYRRKGERDTANGVLLAAGITFLLNAGCYVVVLPNAFRNMH